MFWKINAPMNILIKYTYFMWLHVTMVPKNGNLRVKRYCLGPYSKFCVNNACYEYILKCKVVSDLGIHIPNGQKIHGFFLLLTPYWLLQRT